jgi:hypothetical protein
MKQPNELLSSELALPAMRGEEPPSPPAEVSASTASKLDRLRANHAWVAIHLRLVAMTVRKYQRLLPRLDEFIQTAAIELVETVGDDVPRLGGVNAVAQLMMPMLVRAQDRRRKSFETRSQFLSLDEVLLEILDSGSPSPERRVSEAQEAARWSKYLLRVRELAQGDACLEVLLDAMADEERPGTVARARGFTDADIKNARKRLARIGVQAAHDIRIVPFTGETKRPGETS